MAVLERMKGGVSKAKAKVAEAKAKAGRAQAKLKEAPAKLKEARAKAKEVRAKLKEGGAKLKEAPARRAERRRPTGFDFLLADRIGMVNPAHWDAVAAGASVYLSRAYLAVLEAHAPENVRPRFALVYRDGAPVAAVAAQAVEIRAADLPKPKEKEGALGKASRRALSQVKERVLVCGNLLSWGFHGVAFAPGEDEAALWPAVAEALYRMRRADKLFGETSLVMVKDLTEAAGAQAGALDRFSYRPFDTEPNMVLALDPAWSSFEDYLKALKSGYRNSVVKVRKDLEAAGFTLERLDAAAVAREAAAIDGLYHQVHDGQKMRLMTIDPGYIPALAAAFGKDFATTALRDPEGRMVGFITTLKDQDGCIGYYIGFDKALAASGHSLYLRLLQAAIEDGIAMGARWISLGRTALTPKAQLGARPQPLHCQLRHRIPALNLVVRGLLQALPEPEDAPDRNPFKGGSK